MTNNKISIIIPLYNPGDYIKECIESIINQAYENYEIIIVDDASSDGSQLLVTPYLSEKIKYFSVERGGANKARNFGLKNSTGDYVYFMDQDDFLLSDKVLFKIASYFDIDESIDFVIFKYKEYYSRSKIFRSRPDFEDKILHNSTKFDKLYSFVKNGNVPISPWDKAFRRDFLVCNGIEFPEGLIAGDINWFIELIECTNNFKVTNEEFYAYRKQVAGSLTSKLTITKFENFLHLLEIEVQRTSQKPDSRAKELYFSFLAYEYCILIGLSFSIKSSDRNQYSERINSLTWLLEYDINVKVKKVKVLLNLFGYTISGLILNQYIKRISK